MTYVSCSQWHAPWRVVLLFFMMFFSVALAATHTRGAGNDALFGAPAAAPTTMQAKEPETYCEALQLLAAEQSQAKSLQHLTKLLTEVEAQARELDRKTALLTGWVGRRDAFVARASARLIDLFSAMPTEAAALQLAALPDDIAASILLQVDAKKAAPLLADMDVAKAARLAQLLAASVQLSRSAVPQAETSATGTTPTETLPATPAPTLGRAP